MQRVRIATVWAMVALRVALCPLIFIGAQLHWAGLWLAFIVVIALVDDIFDGVLARRWSCDTPALRLSDSLADTIFYLGVLGALFSRSSEVILANRWLFASLLALELFRYAFDLRKYGKAASYHSYLAKIWGLLLAIAMVGVFAYERLVVLVPIALLWGILVNIEGIAMSLILPKWINDVKTLARAWSLRQEMLEDSSRS